ncbi:MAG: hypothetical protein HFE85_03150 [Clostridiales bacterium]|nr:hypothetical protein [Clostridiales bacterium]
MGKKLACFTMILALLCSLTGCGSSADTKETYDLFMKSAQFVNEQDGVSLSMYGMLTTEYNKQKSVMSISSYYQQQVTDGVKQVDSIFSVAETTAEEPTEVKYVTDGKQYAYVQDNQYHVLTAEEFEKMTSFHQIVTAFEADAVSSADVEKPEEGKTLTTYTLKLDKNKTSELATALLEQTLRIIDTSTTPVDFKNSKVTAKLTVDAENNPVSLGYTLETDATAQGETMEITLNFHYSIQKTGDEVQVAVGDLSSYLEAQQPSADGDDSSADSSER